jgi:DNA-binding transcriptional ArsR family regulator
VKDHGIDAQWEAELPQDPNYAGPLLGPGRNISQFKQRDVFAQGRAKALSGLTQGLKAAIKKLDEETGKRPDRYVIFTNLDMSHEQKNSLKQEALEDYDRPQDVHVEVVGAAELAAFLNDLPHIRSSFFATNKFMTWEAGWNAHTQRKIYGASVELIGRDDELRAVSSALDDPTVRAVILSGPNNIGKTRLALEAARARWIDTVVAVDPRSMTTSDLLAFEHPARKTVVLIEDPDPDDAEGFINQALARTDLKLLITFPTPESAPGPEFGGGDRVRVFKIRHLDESDSAKLLKAAGAQFDYSMESWVVEQCGGNPGILLLAAKAGPEIREGTGDFFGDLARSFEKRVRRAFGERAIEILRRLSLLTYVGIKGGSEEEIQLICRALGDDVQANTVLNELPSLEDAGIVRVRGTYAEVQPRIFANHLAVEALRGRYAELLTLLVGFDNRARFRFLQRLHGLRGIEVARFWDEMFSPGGPFENIHSALRNAHILRIVAAAVPERVAWMIEDGLKGMNRAERLAIAGGLRRNLMWAIEEFLFRRKTSTAAMRSLGMLAEAENENVGNSATGVFCECFMPFHPQCPLPLHDRLTLLDETLSLANSTEMRLIGIQAIGAGLERHGAVMLRRGSGLEPLDSRPRMTYGEVFDYLERLVGLLIAMAKSAEQRIAEKAVAALPFSIAALAIQGRPERAVQLFTEVVDWIVTGTVAIPVSDLVDAIRYAQTNFEVHEGETDEQTVVKFRALTEQMEALVQRLENCGFPTRLRRWAGGWSRDDHTNVSEEGQRPVYRSEKELTKLAGEVIANPDLLTENLLTWLCSDEAKKAYIFFWALGKSDLHRSLLPTMENLARRDAGAGAFASYCGGLCQHSREVVASRLDELTRSREIAAEAVIKATQNIGVDAAGVQRLQILLEDKRVDPSVVARAAMYSSWSDSTDPSTFLPLLRSTAGPTFEHASEVIDFLAMRLQAGNCIEGEVAEFAWQCLEACPPVNINQAYDCDQLAANVAGGDPERALKLLVKLLKQHGVRSCWEPLERHGGAEFWKRLQASLGERVLLAVLDCALANPLVRVQVTWSLADFIDQKADAEVLVSFATQGERQAGLVAEVIDGGKPGFWAIAIKIIEKYPQNKRILSALADGAEHIGHVITGSHADHLERCRKEVEVLLEDDSIPVVALDWLRELESSLRAYRDRERASEIDEEVNGFVRIAGDSDAPERLWAIRTLLRRDKLKELLTTLSKADLLALLPRLELSGNEAAEICKRIETF